MTSTVRKVVAAVATVAAMSAFTSSVSAYERYNDPPAGNAQYAQCLKNAGEQYNGGEQSSPIPHQSKAQAWCTCLWDETPEDFKGNLTKFAATTKGAATNKTCEKYSNWRS